MTSVLRIPDKFETLPLMTGMDMVIDTKGLACEICPRGGDIFVRLEGTQSRITVRENEKFDFCGKIVVSVGGNSPSVDCFYYHTL